MVATSATHDAALRASPRSAYMYVATACGLAIQFMLVMPVGLAPDMSATSSTRVALATVRDGLRGQARERLRLPVQPVASLSWRLRTATHRSQSLARPLQQAWSSLREPERTTRPRKSIWAGSANGRSKREVVPAETLGPACRDEIAAIFHQFAQRCPSLGEPVISRSGMRSLLAAIGERPSASKMHRMYSEADLNRDGNIAFEEFMSRTNRFLSSLSFANDARASSTHEAGRFSTVAKMNEAFRVLDGDCDGVISAKDLSSCLSIVGKQMSREDAAAFISRCDDGELSLNRFQRLIFDNVAPLSWRLRSCFRAMLVVGGPNSGKGLLCESLQQHAQVQAIDTGAVLRAEAEAGSKLGDNISRAMRQGRLLPSSQVVGLLRRTLAERASGSYVAISGFPQNVKNCTDFTQVLGRPEFAVFLDAPAEVLIQRGKQAGVSSEDDILKRVERFVLHRQHIQDELARLNVPVYILDAAQAPEIVWQQLLSLNASLERYVLTQSARSPLG